MNDDAHFSCALAAVLMARVGRIVGPDGPGRVLEEAGSARTLAYVTDIGNWVSYDEAMALLAAGEHLTGDPQFARSVGGDFVRHLAGSANSDVLRTLGSTEQLLRKIAVASHRFSTTADLEAVDVRPGHAVISATATPGFVRHPLHCQWTAGLLTQVTVLFGMPPANVEELQCGADGAACCTYRITWDPAAAHATDPGERAAMLQKQLDAMSERLQSMFDTAADLIGSGDLDGTLARITARAAWQVRVPRYLLAVRPTPEAELLCHQKGFDADEARCLAARALQGDRSTLPDNWLIADVRSERKRYGALVAVQREGAKFFPHERQLLEVYARYAATALDTATALAEAKARHEEALRRYEESRALIHLARQLAHAATSDQVAERLAQAVPGVIDCDRVGIFLWSAADGELVRQAVHVTAPGGDEVEDGLHSIRPTENAILDDGLARPDAEPVFLDLADPAIGSPLAEIGVVAAVAVPIVTGDRFLGCFIASVFERPERLERSPELVERLQGVAAHAVTALENGRLVDQMAYQATHDPLTGAANRAAFNDRLATAMCRTPEEGGTSALFYLDLDAFKPINDRYGHDVGDQVLCAVTTRLRACVRGTDLVARLGGDEFAVLVESVADDAQLAAVSARLERAFDEPFDVDGETLSVSAAIGRAELLAGSDPGVLLRQADAAMYARKRTVRS